MKLFMKDAKVKMSENLSSWALQSEERKEDISLLHLGQLAWWKVFPEES